MYCVLTDTLLYILYSIAQCVCVQCALVHGVYMYIYESLCILRFPLPSSTPSSSLSLSLSLSLDDRVCERVMSSRELSEYPGHEGDETTHHKVSRKKRGGCVCVCVCVSL